MTHSAVRYLAGHGCSEDVRITVSAKEAMSQRPQKTLCWVAHSLIGRL